MQRLEEKDTKDNSRSTWYQGTKNCSFHSSKKIYISKPQLILKITVQAQSALHSHPSDQDTFVVRQCSHAEPAFPKEG